MSKFPLFAINLDAILFGSPGYKKNIIYRCPSTTASATSKVEAGGSYFINGNAGYRDIEIEFPGMENPSAGIYSIEPLGGSRRYGTVSVRMLTNSSKWPAITGKEYLTVKNNKVTATSCSVPVYNQTFNYAATATASITEQ